MIYHSEFMSSIFTYVVHFSLLYIQGAWSIVLLMIPGSNFSSLLDYFGPTSWCFYALTASALVVLRHREPGAARPYKIPLYPLPPLIVICIAAVILVSSLMVEPLFIILALGFVSLSIPAHILMEWYEEKQLIKYLHEQLSVVDSVLSSNNCVVSEDDDNDDDV